MKTYVNSAVWLARALRVTPSASQTRSKSVDHFPEGAFPAFVSSGYGARLCDLDGHVYVDWICALGAVGLGYSNLRVRDAVQVQLWNGVSFSLPHPLEAETAKLILRYVAPWAEQVRFVKTGSEATEAAMRIARLATGRDIVISIGYHGWHSVHDASKPLHPGVPTSFEADFLSVDYNDLTQLAADLIADRAVAAVLLEPVLVDPPASGYLQSVRNLCDRHGALLIFDEMVTGFRWALGGASEFFGVQPDLACFGKAMGSGFPIACVVGPASLMQHATRASSTFGGDTVALAAASATIKEYVDTRAVETMWKRGAEFFKGIAESCGGQCFSIAAGFKLSPHLPLIVEGYAVHPRIQATTGDREQDRLIMSVFLQECAEAGALFHHAGFNVSAALTDEDVRVSIAAVKHAVDVLLRTGGDWVKALRGKLIQPSFQRVAVNGPGGV